MDSLLQMKGLHQMHQMIEGRYQESRKDERVRFWGERSRPSDPYVLEPESILKREMPLLNRKLVNKATALNSKTPQESPV